MHGGKLGFVLIPDRKAMIEAIRLSKAIEANELELDLSWKLPHVTVLQTHFTKNFDYRSALKQARNHKGFQGEPYTRFNGVSIQDADRVSNIIWWNIVNADWLKDFNRELIETFESEIIKPNDAESLVFASPEAKDSYERTGYSRNLEAYEPHITIGISESLGSLPYSNLSGDLVRFHRLAFVQHGPHGEITNILASEDLPISWD